MSATHWVYVLQSETTGRYYCGSTDDVERRVRQHNDPDYRGSKTTKRFLGPWRLLWSEPVESRSDAMKRERAIKARGIGRFLGDQGHAQSVESRQRRD